MCCLCRCLPSHNPLCWWVLLPKSRLVIFVCESAYRNRWLIHIVLWGIMRMDESCPASNRSIDMAHTEKPKSPSMYLDISRVLRVIIGEWVTIFWPLKCWPIPQSACGGFKIVPKEKRQLRTVTRQVLLCFFHEYRIYDVGGNPCFNVEFSNKTGTNLSCPRHNINTFSIVS